MLTGSGDSFSLTTRVYQHIRNGIIEGAYSTGDFLVEVRLAEELGVSRTPIREALKQLEQEGLVVSIPNRGAMVQGLSEKDINDIYTIRLLLESQAAYWAATRISPEHFARLGEVMDLMGLYAEKNDIAKLTRMDSEFHEVLVAACDSRTLSRILASLNQQAQRAKRSIFSTTPMRPKESLQEHRAIYDAIAAHDPEQAEAAMRAHISLARSLFDDGAGEAAKPQT